MCATTDWGGALCTSIMRPNKRLGTGVKHDRRCYLW
jgi:hypothetical protein